MYLPVRVYVCVHASKSVQYISAGSIWRYGDLYLQYGLEVQYYRYDDLRLLDFQHQCLVDIFDISVSILSSGAILVEIIM